MLSDFLHKLVEHFPDQIRAVPFLVATTRFDDGEPSVKIDTKTLVTALIVAVVTGLATAAFATYSTTKELAMQFNYLSKQIADTSAKVEQHSATATADRLMLIERMARIETMSGMQGRK